MSFLKVTFIALFFIYTSASYASDMCEKYRKANPPPDWYYTLCEMGGSSPGGAGGGFSSYAAPFNLNPATIPAFETPIGFEYIRSFSSGYKAKNNFALLKGFKAFGFAISSNSDNTIYSNSSSLANRDSPQYNVPTNDNAPATSSFGTSFSFAQFLPKKVESIFPSIGLLIRHSSATGENTPGLGLSVAFDWLTLSLSQIDDPATSTTPRRTTTTTTTGIKLPGFQFDFAYIKSKSNQISYTYITQSGPVIFTPTNPAPTLIATMATNIEGFNITAAARKYQDATLTRYTQFHIAVQTQLTNMIGVGYYYNYVPGYHSLGIQCML